MHKHVIITVCSPLVLRQVLNYALMTSCRSTYCLIKMVLVLLIVFDAMNVILARFYQYQTDDTPLADVFLLHQLI